MNFKKPIGEEDGWKLLEQNTFDNRSIVVWYNPDNHTISLMLGIFNDQPNELSLNSPNTPWGYITHMVSNMHSTEEASKVVRAYVQDMKDGYYWWEKD